MLALTDTAVVSLLVPIITTLLAGLGWLLKRSIEGTVTSAADALASRNSDEHEINKAALLGIQYQIDANHRESLAAIREVGDRVTALEDHVTTPVRSARKKEVA